MTYSLIYNVEDFCDSYWHVAPPPSLLVSATVLIGGSLGSTEDPGKTCLCDVMQVVKLIRDSVFSFRSRSWPFKATVKLRRGSPFS